MSFIANIDSIPLFTTSEEAISWALVNGTSGFHTHEFQGQTGYMGGSSHQQALSAQMEPEYASTSTSTTAPSEFSSGGGGY